MNRTQTLVVVGFVLALIGLLTCAPYEYRVHDEIGRLVNGWSSGETVRGITYAPIWRPPAGNAGLIAPAWARDVAGSGAMVDDVQLSAGRLGIYLGVLVAVTALALLATTRRGSIRDRT